MRQFFASLLPTLFAEQGHGRPTPFPRPGEVDLEIVDLEESMRPLELPLFTPDGSRQHTLVLGPAGSGRSLLLARLSRQAHQDERQVVVISMRGSQGPLYHLARYLAGTTRDLITREHARFNPFWFSAAPDSASCREPSNEELRHLIEVLIAVLPLALPGGVADRDWHNGMGRFIVLFYRYQPWREDGGSPDFNSFYEFVSRPLEALPDWVEQPTPAQHFQQWFLTATKPFYRGGGLDYLMNAAPGPLPTLRAVQNRFLYLNLALGDPLAEPGQPTEPYGGADAVRLQAAFWLLLYALDAQVGCRQGQQLTVVLDELNYDVFSSDNAAHAMQRYYLDRLCGREASREVIAAWQDTPDVVFKATTYSPPGCQPDGPSTAAQVMLQKSQCQLLLGDSRVKGRVAAGYASGYEVLAMSHEEQALFTSLRVSERQVLVRFPDSPEASRVYTAKLSLSELSDYLSPERAAR